MCVNIMLMALHTDLALADVQILAVSDLADHLGISRHAVHQRIRRGQIPQPHRKVGGERGCLLWFLTVEMDYWMGSAQIRGR